MEVGSSTDYNLLSESLLEPSTPARDDPQNDSNPTPLRYFFSDGNKNETPGEAESEQADDEDSIETVDREKQVQLVALTILGKPFQKTFWFQDWPIAALMGALLGVGTLAFLAAVHGTLDLWFRVPEYPNPNWRWLIITSVGGFVCGIVLLLPQAPSVGTVRTMYHDAIDLKVCEFFTNQQKRNMIPG